jgi:hypothetical protein
MTKSALVAGVLAAMLLAGCGQDDSSGLDTSSLIEAADTDSSGSLSRAEWTSSGHSADSFGTVDRNSDGAIASSEYAVWLINQPRTSNAEATASDSDDGMPSPPDPNDLRKPKTDGEAAGETPSSGVRRPAAEAVRDVPEAAPVKRMPALH